MKNNIKNTILFFATASLSLTSCAKPTLSKITAFQCDTFFEYYDYEEGKIANELKEKVDELENIFDPNREGSDLYRLNTYRTGTFSKDFINCLREALAIKEETNGYYNPFMGKLSNEWKCFLDNIRFDPLSEDEINYYLAEINSTSVTILADTVTITGDADIDLGGICKGYIIDCLYEYVKEKTDHYLVNGGASSVLFGKKPSDKEEEEFFTASLIGGEYTLLAKDTTLSTSGVSEQYRIYDNKMYSHLINPKTGSAVVGATNEVVLMGRDGSKGDALATAFMFMNDAERLALASLEGFKYAIYDSTNTFEGWSYMSEGLNIEYTKTRK